jgi:hypothetical protein
MPIVIVHFTSEDPIVGDLDVLPTPTDNLISLKNPRKKDGKDVPYLEPNVTIVVWPLARINFIEVMSAGADEEIISFVRE